jgi:hypothetical protein
MPKNSKRGVALKESLSSLARSVTLLKSEIRISSQEVQTGLTQVRDEMRTGFDQLYRHIDGFVKLHETLDIEMKVLKEQMNRLEDRVKRLEAS